MEDRPLTSTIDEREDEFKSYFYVFVAAPSDKQNPNNHRGNSDASDLDGLVYSSFLRLEGTYQKQAKVNMDDSQNDTIRKAFGITQLPAFGISNFDLSTKDEISSSPPLLPSQWNPLKWSKRKEMLKDSEYLPKVERDVMELFNSPEEMFHFIRDLHIANVDGGLASVAQNVEGKVRKLGGKKLLRALETGRRVFYQ